MTQTPTKKIIQITATKPSSSGPNTTIGSSPTSKRGQVNQRNSFGNYKSKIDNKKMLSM